MTIEELTVKVKNEIGKRSHEDNFRLLVSANIIDKNGYFHKDFFSPETVARSKKHPFPIPESMK